METRWMYLTSDNFAELREKANRTCVIPMGCIEKHGLHAPLGTDVIEASVVAHMASQLETVCVFPDFIFGDVPIGAHLKTRPEGTICLDVRTQMLLLEQLCDEIANNGFNKILVLNSHGGNVSWLDTFSRNLGVKPNKYVFSYMRMPSTIVPKAMGEYILEHGSGSVPELTKEDEELILKYHKEGMITGHACMTETAWVMGVAPESVHLEKLGIESGLPQESPIQHLLDAGIIPPSYGWGFEYPNAFAGHDPVGCNERIGKAALRMESERVAKAFKLYKEDTVLLESKRASYKDPSWLD